MGLRSLLNRQQRPAEPLARLAELGRAEDPPTSPLTPTQPKAHPTREAIAAPISPVGLTKKARSNQQRVAVSACPKSVQEIEKRGPLDPRAWRSQKSREARSEAVHFADTTF